MRYLMLGKLVPGMQVGQEIYDADGSVTFGKRHVLGEDDLDLLGMKGIPGIYVEDEASKDIDIHPILRPEVKGRALRTIHDMFARDLESPITQEELSAMVQDVIADIHDYGNHLCDILDMKVYDHYTYFHCLNVAVISGILALSLDLSQSEMECLVTSAVLHDIGKRFVENDVLSAKRRLTEEERRVIVQHPKLGYEFLRDHYDLEPEVFDSVLMHHEWFNGEGYPLRRSGEDIPLYARILKLADVYDALTSRRPYHAPVSPVKAVEYIVGNADVEFDPDLVEIFQKKMAVYPTGCEVRLSDGRIAIVMENDEEVLMRPTVKDLSTGEILDLNDDSHDITVLELLV